MDGFIFLDKKEGISSRSLDNQISKLLNTKKVGHVGTLDPFATGLLIIAVNKASKCVTFFDDEENRSVATIKLGIETDSLDIDGKVIKTQEVPYFGEEDIEKALLYFLGKGSQIPPMTSAVHVNGKKLYELAHKGIEIDREPRPIEIKEIKLLDYSKDTITFEALVSKGTYIRVLGSDIAKKLGTIGHLIKLRRIEVPPFNVKEAIDIKEIKEDKIVPIYDVLSRIAKVHVVDEYLTNRITNGLRKYLKLSYEDKYVLIVNENKDPIAMYEKIDDDKYEFKRGLF